jgi:hypothetical protein
MGLALLHRLPSALLLGAGQHVRAVFFTGQTGDESGWMLVHELGHVIQWKKMLISEIGTGSQPDELRMRTFFNARLGSLLHNRIQDDANRYACHNTTRHGKWHQEYCE